MFMALAVKVGCVKSVHVKSQFFLFEKSDFLRFFYLIFLVFGFGGFLEIWLVFIKKSLKAEL